MTKIKPVTSKRLTVFLILTPGGMDTLSMDGLGRFGEAFDDDQFSAEMFFSDRLVGADGEDSDGSDNFEDSDEESDDEE